MLFHLFTWLRVIPIALTPSEVGLKISTLVVFIWG